STADGVAPSTPGGPDAQRRARDRLAPWPDAAGDLGLAGRDAAGPAHLANPGGATGRSAGVAAGGAQRHGPAGSRGADAPALRGADQRRGGPGAGPEQDGREQPLYPRPGAAAGDPRQHPRPAGAVRTNPLPREVWPMAPESSSDERDPVE